MKDTGIVYKIINLYTGRYYVGSTMELEKRVKRHLHELMNNKHHNPMLQKAWSKYGGDYFDFIIVEGGLSEVECRSLEQSILDDNIATGILYNTSPKATGGDLISMHPNNAEIRKKIGKASKHRYENMPLEERLKLNKLFQGEANGMFARKHTEQAKEKMRCPRPGLSKKLKGTPKSEDHKRKMSENASKRMGELNPFYGREHTDETKKAISEKNKGNTPPNIRKISINNITYNSISEASKILNIPSPTIHWRINSNNEKYKNYLYL